jgi:TPR repeat protein
MVNWARNHMGQSRRARPLKASSQTTAPSEGGKRAPKSKPANDQHEAALAPDVQQEPARPRRPRKPKAAPSEIACDSAAAPADPVVESAAEAHAPCIADTDHAAMPANQVVAMAEGSGPVDWLEAGAAGAISIDSETFIAAACEDDAFEPMWPDDRRDQSGPEQTPAESVLPAIELALAPTAVQTQTEQLQPLTPAPRALAFTPAPRNLGYLERAREAANAHAQAQRSQKTRWLDNPKALGVTAAIAAPVLLGAALLLNVGGEHAQAPAPASAAAPPSPAPHAQATEQYAAALRLIGEGEIARGTAALRASAEAGFPLAQYRLAKAYERGQGVPRDLATARMWALRAARAGNCRAMHDAGVFLARGDGGPLDAQTAYRWFRAAAECGVADSQYNLGVLYRQGRGVEADSREALFWFLVAAYGAHHDTGALEQALDLATELTPMDVEEARARAHAFRTQAPDPFANGADSAPPR